MENILNSPLFGISITLIAFELGVLIYKKIKSPLLSPFILSIVFIVSFLLIFKIPTASYQKGGNIINMLLTPATSALAISMYHKIKTIITGTFVGSLVSITSILLMSMLFNLDNNLVKAILPKSVTMPIALDLSQKTGGIASVTICCVCISGILGAVFSPLLIKIFKIKNPVSAGLAIGTSSHGVGTAKAIEIGETEGALSSIAIGLSGVMTVIIYIFL